MRIRRIRILHAAIPLRMRISHASHSRRRNDTILVCCHLDDGTEGWGEGLPREYVTGESIDTAWQHLREFDLRPLGAGFTDLRSLLDLAERAILPVPAEKRDCFGNAARCALELAILDAGCRSLQVPLSQLVEAMPQATPLRQQVPQVQYSAVLTGSSPLKTRLRAWMFRLDGFRQCKLKVGRSMEEDRRLLKLVRRTLGPRVELRVDANEAWSPEDLPERFHLLQEHGVVSVEQPVPHVQVRELAKSKRPEGIRVVLDESVCSLSDARRAIDEGLAEGFNIRLSKCGGWVPAVRMARMAKDAGLSYQLGCQVGETGLLSAAGRHFATSIAGLSAVEGSFDRWLVRERLTIEDLTFGRQGRGPALSRPGLGVRVDPRAIERVCVRREIRDVS